MIHFEALNISVPNSADGSVRTLIRELTLELEDQGSLAIIGPNGSGKSTLLKVLVGLVEPELGSARTNGRNIGYMPQNYRSGVLSWISVDRHLELALDTEGRAYASELIKRMGLNLRGHQKLASLSGGELQLLSLASQLAKSSDILLLDEPLAAVDYARRQKVIEILAEEFPATLKNLVMVTHHLEDAQQLCERALILSGGDDPMHRVVAHMRHLDFSGMFA